jgi:hypothetical protein
METMNSPETWRTHSKIRLVLIVILVSVALFVTVGSAVGQSGALKVTSFPSVATLASDGNDTGKTTPMSTSLSVGDHTVVVSIPSSGWNPDTRTVTIVSGNNDLSVTLLPILTVGPQGPKGDKGDKGDTGAQGIQGQTGATGAQGMQGVKGDKGDAGPTGPQGPAGPGGINGMQQFTNNAHDGSTATYSWTAPAGVSHVIAQMWGAGGGGGSTAGGGGAAYGQGVIDVTPGTVYTINVGGGGNGFGAFQHDATDGSNSSILQGSTVLFFASGGGGAGGDAGNLWGIGGLQASGFGGRGGDADAFGGGAAFGASFCPVGPSIGHGGGPLGGAGSPGWVLLTW